MLQTPLESEKEILGYKLIERIGSGGFGEVWSAVAPGGLKKAVKVVYGYHDGRRAQAELKALDRVKELRHPFLLSLERIEVFDGQLVVVSELADMSLADLFNRYVERNETGIPRSELLVFMKCAAEALDYLSDEHNLQHLDVKPENMLIVGSHVKVADFGLIKDLQQASQSLMSGMTPSYAAPELFDGRPVSNSDQYSLAIVYQEMLTGLRPFPGNTPAQLAAQHMHGKPNLSKLPKQDQSIIAKALSKDPNVRFANCRHLIEELSNQRRTARKKAIRRQPQLLGRDSHDTESNTLGIDSGGLHDVTNVMTEKALPFMANEISLLPPPDTNVDESTVRPTLIVGIGSTGNKVVQKVKGMLSASYSHMSEIPAIKMFAIDTDRKALGNMRRDRGFASFSNVEAIETPLRKPEGYRGRAQSHLAWLSRRWIYNVPRSLQTEGLRPLGRLAFADHFELICDRIQQAIKEMTTVDALARTADAMNIDPGSVSPRVFIVSSVSGGVGSGMMLDLAYTIRILMHECGMHDATMVGIALNSTYQRNRDPGLSAANAFAFLTEMRHFVENGFPGDPSIGLPEIEEEPPFDYSYFNDLGDDHCQSEFDDRLDRVAEYIMLSSASKCVSFFDNCRELEDEIDHFSLRTFGLSATGPDKYVGGGSTVRRIGNGLIRRWLTNSHPDVNHWVAGQFEQANVSYVDLSERLRAKIEEGSPLQIDQLFGDCMELISKDLNNVAGILCQRADEAFGVSIDRRDTTYVDPEHCVQIDNSFGQDAQNDGETIAQTLVELLSGDELQLGFAIEATDGALKTIRKIIDEIDVDSREQSAASDNLMARIQAIPVAKLSTDAKLQEELVQFVRGYLMSRLNQFFNRCRRSYCRVCSNSIDAVRLQLKRYKDQLEMVSNEFNFVEGFDGLLADDDSELDLNRLLSESVEQESESLVAATEKRVYEHLIVERGGYLEALESASVWQNQLAYEIRTQAKRVLVNAYKKTSIEKVAALNGIEPERISRWLNDELIKAKPEIDDCGGATRLLVGVPECSDDEQLKTMLEKQFNVDSCQIKGTQGNFVFCCEGEDISLANVAYRLLQARPDAVELVKRIQTRNDVQWTTLDDLL